MIEDPQVIVSPCWLHERINDPDVRIIDASWYLAAMNRNPIAEYNSQHIPGAWFFDIDRICDYQSVLPHMAPTGDQFLSAISTSGICNDHQLVVYDGIGIFSSPRVWWIFKLMGHDNVAVLDGGLPKWISENRPLSDSAEFEEHTFGKLGFRNHLIADIDRVSLSMHDQNSEIIDARPEGRFTGAEPEARTGLRCGHIPGSKNIPFKRVLNDDDTLLDPVQIEAIFSAAKIDLTKSLITTCGSGITAAVLNLALSRIGHNNHCLYDGSWAEWGRPCSLPIAIGSD
jgi:thiosulfate/3-mercaptopyruvate sulfurtransferase